MKDLAVIPLAGGDEEEELTNGGSSSSSEAESDDGEEDGEERVAGFPLKLPGQRRARTAAGIEELSCH